LRWRPADLPVEQPTKLEHLWGARARWRKGLEPTMVLEAAPDRGTPRDRGRAPHRDPGELVICNRNEANVCHLDDSQVETAAQNDEMFEEPHSIAAEQLAVALDAIEREYRKLCEIYPPESKGGE
jgi:hypothetical protein